MPAVPVVDQLAIQQLVAEYAFCCDTGLYSDVAELFAVDGVWDESILGLPVCAGRDQIHALFRELPARVSYLIHIGSNHRITQFDGQAASATSHLLCEGGYLGADVRIRGYYSDRYTKHDGRWLFAHRQLLEIAPTIGLPDSIPLSPSAGA